MQTFSLRPFFLSFFLGGGNMGKWGKMGGKYHEILWKIPAKYVSLVF